MNTYVTTIIYQHEPLLARTAYPLLSEFRDNIFPSTFPSFWYYNMVDAIIIRGFKLFDVIDRRDSGAIRYHGIGLRKEKNAVSISRWRITRDVYQLSNTAVTMQMCNFKSTARRQCIAQIRCGIKNYILFNQSVRSKLRDRSNFKYARNYCCCTMHNTRELSNSIFKFNWLV